MAYQLLCNSASESNWILRRESVDFDCGLELDYGPTITDAQRLIQDVTQRNGFAEQRRFTWRWAERHADKHHGPTASDRSAND